MDDKLRLVTIKVEQKYRLRWPDMTYRPEHGEAVELVEAISGINHYDTFDLIYRLRSFHLIKI